MNKLRHLLVTPLLALGFLLGNAALTPAAATPTLPPQPEATQDTVIIIIDGETVIIIVIE